MRNVLVEVGGGRSEALSRLAGGVERARRGRGGRFKVQRAQGVGGVSGEGERRRDRENGWQIRLGKKVREEGGSRGRLEGLRMMKLGKWERASQGNTSFQPSGRQIICWDGWGYGLGSGKTLVQSLWGV